jgi:hypothetical protein
MVDISADKQALVDLRDRSISALKIRTNAEEELEMEQSEITEEDYTDEDDMPPEDSQKMMKGKKDKGKKGKGTAEGDLIDAMTTVVKPTVIE